MRELTNKTKLMIVFGLFIFSILLFIVQNANNKGSKDKNLKDLDFVYTISKKDSSELPFINLKSGNIEKINGEINELFYNVTELDENKFEYEYNVHENILYLLLKLEIYDGDAETTKYRYISYNFDIKTGNIYSNKEILDKYNYSFKDTDKLINNRIKGYYDTIKKEELFDTNECNYSCYLRRLEIKENGLSEGIALYYDKNLTFYKNMDILTFFDDGKLYNKDSFKYEFD
jgi:hypothetical protein